MEKRLGNIANVLEERREEVEFEGTADPEGVCIVFGVNGGETRLAGMEVSPIRIRCVRT